MAKDVEELQQESQSQERTRKINKEAALAALSRLAKLREKLPVIDAEALIRECRDVPRGIQD